MKFSTAALATIALVGYTLGVSAMTAQGQVGGVAPIGEFRWPPRVADIVNIDGTTNISPNLSHKIYTVPKDKYFILTDYNPAWGRNAPGVDILQQRANVSTVKWRWQSIISMSRSPGDGHSLGTYQVGLVFAPGSDVVLRGVSGAPGGPIWWHIRGYLTDK